MVSALENHRNGFADVPADQFVAERTAEQVGRMVDVLAHVRPAEALIAEADREAVRIGIPRPHIELHVVVGRRELPVFRNRDQLVTTDSAPEFPHPSKRIQFSSMH